MARQRIPGRVPRSAPVVFLDEIDVLQMVYSAITEEPKNETMGLFRGTRELRGERSVYHLRFVQPLQYGRRDARSIAYADRRFARLQRSRYNFHIIGDYHSHPNGVSHLTRSDLKFTLEKYPEPSEVLLGVLAVSVLENETGKHQKREEVISWQTKIIYQGGEYRVDIFFYTFRRPLERIPRTGDVRRLVRRVYPVFKRRPEIRQRNNHA